MSRTLQNREVQFDVSQLTPGSDTIDIPLLTQPTGLRVTGNVLQSTPNDCYALRNMYVEKSQQLMAAGNMLLRGEVGTAGVDDILTIHCVRYATHRVFVVATLTGIWWCGENAAYLVPEPYTQMTGPAFSGLAVGDRFSFVQWGTNLICTNPIAGMFEIDLATKTYSRITDAPQDAQFVSLFNGRLFATGIYSNPNRVQWSVKFSSTDWSGLGSGYEDLAPTSNSGLNTVQKLFPLSDTTALLTRSESVDIVSATDRFDTPFAFTSRHTSIGCIAPFAAVQVGNGVIVPTYQNIYLVTPEQYASIADNIPYRGQGTYRPITPLKSYAIYNPGLNEYWLITGYSNDTALYKYSFHTKTWGVQTINNSNWYSMAWGGSVPVSQYGYWATYVTYNTIPGTLEYLTSTDAVYISGNTVIAYSNKDYETGYLQSGSDDGFSYTTVDVWGATPEDSVTIHHLELVYFSIRLSPNQLDITVEYSLDFGSTWSTYGTTNNTNTTALVGKLTRLTLWKTISGPQVRFRISSSNPVNHYAHISLVVRAVKGAKVYNG